MKKFIIYMAAVLAAILPVGAADGDLFPYPKPPADMTKLMDRCDYLVTKFWAPCDFKSAMSKMDKFNATFSDWIQFMPYASADSVHSAIDVLLKRVAKSGPQTLTLARMAEAYAHSDSAEIYSDEIFLPFAKAAASHKKISAADRARFESQVAIIENTQQGKPVGHLDFVKPDGSKGSLPDVRTQMIVLMFNDHDCDDCKLARIRLSADINATALIKAGVLTVMCIQPGDATDEWKAAAAGYPADWLVCAAPEADGYFSLRHSPQIYLLDSRHRLLAKDVDIDGLLQAMAALRKNSGY